MEYDPDFVERCMQTVKWEKRKAKQTGKRMNEAIRDNVQDIDFLDRLADELMDTMLGLSGAGERTYRKYIRYMETFNPQAAAETKEAYEDIMGYKLHVAYAAARMAKRLHMWQLDKAGKDYFKAHLLSVGRRGTNWKEKAVGYLHDAAEYTGYTVEEIVYGLKNMMKDWENPKASEWVYEFKDVIGSLPNEKYHKLTRQEWEEIEEALRLLNSGTAANREEYIERFCGHQLAIKVKMNELLDNMDISCRPHLTEKDFDRAGKYKEEYDRLLTMLGDCPASPFYGGRKKDWVRLV